MLSNQSAELHLETRLNKDVLNFKYCVQPPGVMLFLTPIGAAISVKSSHKHIKNSSLTADAMHISMFCKAQPNLPGLLMT